MKIFDVIENPIFKGEERVEFIRGDLRRKDQLLAALKGVDVVFHTAAVIDYWRSLDFEWSRFEEINIKGTDTVVQACIESGVKKLIAMSSSNVVVNIGQAIRNGNESLPYCTNPPNHYCRSKMLAEKVNFL